MYYYEENLINPIVDDEPDPYAANVLQEGLGGQFGEMRTMMQYFFQSCNFRGNAITYKDLIHSVFMEEISHVELITRTISKLLDGSAAAANGNGTIGKSKGNTKNNRVGPTTLEIATDTMNPHHFIVGAQGALPVDAAGNPWSGSYVHNHGNLVLDLLDNLVLESTGRLQKCRIYQMSSNKTLRATVSFLIARDEAHEMAFAKALESLGVDWGRILPIPKFDTSEFPEVQKLVDAGINRQQYHFRLDKSQLEKIFNGPAPADDDTGLEPMKEPDENFEVPLSPERMEEFAPGLDAELQEMVDALNDYKEKAATKRGKNK